MLKILLIDEQYYCFIQEIQPYLTNLEEIILPIGLMYIATYLKDKLKNKVEVRI